MRFQAGIQIILIIISVVIITTVIKPKFSEITFNQDEIAEYQNAVGKADEYGQKLQELINNANNIPRADRFALDRFLPTTIDATVVARDIENIVKQNGLLILDIGAEEPSEVTISEGDRDEESEDGFMREGTLMREARNALSSQLFTVEVIGGYEQMKKMLADFEKNAYPLRLVKFAFDAREDAILYRFSMELETYALNLPE